VQHFFGVFTGLPATKAGMRLYAIENTQFFSPRSDPFRAAPRNPFKANTREHIMEIGLGILTFGTLGFVLAFAYINKRVTERQLEETRSARAAETAETSRA
jgi:hypothetical protein